MKSFKTILFFALLLPAMAYAQTYPSPTFDSLTLQNPLTVSNGGTGGTTSTGTGALVFSTSPTLVTPALGTPASGILTNATGLPLTTGITGTLSATHGGTGTTSSTGSGSVVLSTSPTLVTPALGTPSSVTLTNATGLPLTTGVTGTLPAGNGGTGITSLGTGVATALGANVTGSGGIVLATSPALTTPNLGTPSAAILTNATGLPVTTGISQLGTGVALALGGALNGTISAPFGVLGSFNPTIFQPFIVGVTNASSAPAGDVGEYISATGTSVSMTTATITNIASISLTAGDWDVSGGSQISDSASTLSNMLVGASTTSATLGSAGTWAQNQFGSGTGNMTSYSAAIPQQRINVSSTTTVYLIGYAIFISGTVTANGIIQARRVR